MYKEEELHFSKIFTNKNSIGIIFAQGNNGQYLLPKFA